MKIEWIDWMVMATAISALLGLFQTSVQPMNDGRRTVKVFSNLSYGSGAVERPRPGSKELLADVYMPIDGDPKVRFPAALLLHGGGFRRGGKEGAIGELARALASRGVVAVSINYRLVHDSPPGEQKDELRRTLFAAREDAAKALDWMRRNADRFRIDGERIGVGGSSAGAITALFLAYGKPGPSTVGAVVDLWGGLYGEERLIQAGDPPLLIVHGSEDRTVPYQLGLDLRARCQEAGVPFEFHAVPGEGHGFASIPPTSHINGRDLATVVADFLKEKLVGKP